MATATLKSGVTVVHTKHGDDNELEERRESFDVGALFASSFSSMSDVITVQIHANTSLTLNMVSRQVSDSRTKAHMISLWYKQRYSSVTTVEPNHGHWLCFIPITPERCMENGLNLTIHGPGELQFQARVHPPSSTDRSINVFGTISGRDEPVTTNTTIQATPSASVVHTVQPPRNGDLNINHDEGHDHDDSKVDVSQPPTEKSTNRKKRKAVDDDDHHEETNPALTHISKTPHDETLQNGTASSISNNHQPQGNVDDDAPVKQPLSKRQRRKLAKQKAEELATTLSALKQPTPGKADADISANSGTANGTALKDDKAAFSSPAATKAATTSSSSKKATPSVPITKPRRLPGGILVQDYLLGNGVAVKTGRKVAIVYEGRFPNGQVFDKSKNPQRPLIFRPGTGQVVPGLDQGMQGMRVGGKREITIPPELGYGTKGSPPVVPPNATLIFNVELLRAGGQ
jgi:FKBP-type peptidyl-prolyl cis-trans isomerase